MADGRRDDGWESQGRLPVGGLAADKQRSGCCVFLKGRRCAPLSSESPAPGLGPYTEQVLRNPLSLDLRCVPVKAPGFPIPHQALPVGGMGTPCPSPSLVEVAKAGDLESGGPGSEFRLYLLLAV